MVRKTRRNEKTLGVLGGMGPEATIDFMEKVLHLTPAAKDQDHLRMIVVHDPKVPDRTKALLYEGENPLPLLRKNARRLETVGADLAVMPCNTAHYWLEEIRNAVEIPVLDMIKETAKVLSEKEVTEVGLLSTTATAEFGLYDKRFGSIEIVTPNNMEEVMHAIKSIKAGRKKKAQKILSKPTRKLLDRGVDAVVAGCTEISLVLNQQEAPVVDPVSILAKRVIEIVKGESPPFSLPLL